MRTKDVYLWWMKEPFDIIVGEQIYAVFPEEDGIYTIFKDGAEYIKIQQDSDLNGWLKLDPETDLPYFGEDEEVIQIGREIQKNEID